MPSDDDLTTALLHLGADLRALRDLVEYAAQDCPRIPAVQGWCLEALFMHARVAAGFFLRSDSRDYCAGDFSDGWRLRDGAARSTLEHALEVASQQVAHLSRSRIMRPGDRPEPVDFGDLQLIVSAADRAAFQFVADYWQVACVLVGRNPFSARLEALQGLLPRRAFTVESTEQPL